MQESEQKTGRIVSDNIAALFGLKFVSNVFADECRVFDVRKINANVCIRQSHQARCDGRIGDTSH